jgi:hypothetical protein
MKNATLNRVVLVIFIAIVSFVCHAQKGTISGKIFSLPNNLPVAQANIKLFKNDSLLMIAKISDSTGSFLIEKISAGSYKLQVDALSYSTQNKSVHISPNEVLHDTILLEPSFENLQSVVVTAKKPAVIVKTDTTEFFASSFRTTENATVEDVLKKMPDIEVSKNGAIKVQGEVVTQIYVDGKPFFGNDLKAVTQNFSDYIIYKIQIFYKKSDQAVATKVDDGSYERIINITLKKANKKGVFGKDYVSYGTRHHYEAKATANFFNYDKKFSMIAGANNTGRNDAGSNAAINTYGTTENNQAKISYANKIGSNFDFSTWAGYDKNKTVVQQEIERQNIFLDSTTNYFENSSNSNRNRNLYGGLYFEYKPDTLSFFRFNESINLRNNSFSSLSQFNTAAFNNYKINEGHNGNSNSSKSPSLNGQISYNRRLSATGRNLFVSFSNNINNNNIVVYNNSNNYFYPIDSIFYTSLLKQFQYSDNKNTNIGTAISYTEPLAYNQSLNISYAYNFDNNTMPKEVYDYNEQSEVYNVLVDSLSYNFINSTSSNTLSVNYNYNARKIGFGTGIRWKQSLTQSFASGKENVYEQGFRGFLPNMSFYSIGKGRRLSVYYNSFIQTPQPYQLQPVIDNTDPLYLKLGNPDLKYAVIHMLRYNFKNYNARKERGINSNANFYLISNNITNSIRYDNITGKQVSQPINGSGAYSWNAWLSYFEPLHLLNDKIKWNMGFNTGGSKINSRFNSEGNINRNGFLKIIFGLTYDTPEWLDIRTNFSLIKQSNKYSLQLDLDNRSYYLTVSPDITLNPGKNTEINIDYDFRKATDRSTSYHTSTNMLNLHVNEYFDSKRNTWITLSAFNVFDQHDASSQVYGDNFIQTLQTNSVSRYLLLTVNFRFNKIQ